MDILIPREAEPEGVRKGREILYRIKNMAEDAKASGRNPQAIVVGMNLTPYMKEFWDFKAQKFDGILPKRMNGLPITYCERERDKVFIRCES